MPQRTQLKLKLFLHLLKLKSATQTLGMSPTAQDPSFARFAIAVAVVLLASIVFLLASAAVQTKMVCAATASAAVRANHVAAMAFAALRVNHSAVEMNSRLKSLCAVQKISNVVNVLI